MVPTSFINIYSKLPAIYERSQRLSLCNQRFLWSSGISLAFQAEDQASMGQGKFKTFSPYYHLTLDLIWTRSGMYRKGSLSAADGKGHQIRRKNGRGPDRRNRPRIAVNDLSLNSSQHY